MSKKQSLTQLDVWRKASSQAPCPDRVRSSLEQLSDSVLAPLLRSAGPELAGAFAALFSGSPALTDLVLGYPDWFDGWSADVLGHARHAQGFRREVESWLKPALVAAAPAEAFARLRQFKQREMVRIALRDLGGMGRTADITRELSDLADVCLDCVLELCQQPLARRLGQAYHRDAEGRWQPTRFAVIGLGKLGGQELNYSSDVDVVFVYSEEGYVFNRAPGKTVQEGKGLTSHQYFKRLAESYIAEIGKATGEGMFYRIDLRLRPEGESGPLVRSVSSYENYYAQWGQPWERMMLIKARPVAGDRNLGEEFVEMIHSFRYPRSLGGGLLREVAAIKERIEQEVVRQGELERNVKLGRGGIREVEFLVQTLQLMHAGRTPFLQGSQTLPILDKLVEYNLLPRQEATQLAEAYCFLRNIEHRLQMEHNLQTHTIPASGPGRKLLAALMGYKHVADFESALHTHTGQVRAVYEKLLKGDGPEPASDWPRRIEGEEKVWRQIFAVHTFRDPDQAVRLAKEFMHGPGYGHLSNRTTDLARQLMPQLLALCPNPTRPPQPCRKPWVLSDPDRVLARLDSFIAAYGARATLFEIWNSNPSLFELLMLLFDRSEFLAETAIRTPDLVDDLVESGRLSRRKSAPEILEDLHHGLEDKDQRLWLRRYHQAELLRIGLRDILSLADFEQNLIELSALADACLQYALEIVLRQHKIKDAPMVIIGLGKLGGQELNYGSDLDILFVADKARLLPKLQRVAIGVMEMLSSKTELGVAFLTDARLRPDGEKGLLVNTLGAYEDYYRLRAQLWEIQAITRTRPVAGDPALGERFQKLTAVLTNFNQPATPLRAYRPDWKEEVVRMRQRIEKERTPIGQDRLAIKTGRGGLMDAEFIAQSLCLARGWQEANTLRALERARAEGVLPLPAADALIENYRQLRRIEGILRRWSYEGETVLPDHPAPQYRVAVRCGWSSAEEFLGAVDRHRQAIRSVYEQVMK